MNDPVANNSTIDDDPPVLADSDDDINDIEQTGVDNHVTEAIGVEGHQPNNNTELEQDHRDDDAPRWSKGIRIWSQGVEQETA